MPSLLQLKKIINDFDQTYHIVIKKYENETKEDWNKGKYYLGGQISLNLDDDISTEKMNEVEMINKKNQSSICNSWEMGSYNQHVLEFNHIKELVEYYNTQMI